MKDAYQDIRVEILVDGIQVGYYKQDDGLLMWEGSYLSRTAEAVFSWGAVTNLTAKLIEREAYKVDLGLQNSPRMAEQITLFGASEETPVYGVEQVQPAPETASVITDQNNETSPPVLTPADEQFAKEALIPGETSFEIDGRSFLVDRVDLEHGTVNFQDTTFVQTVGFPIFRTEPISFVRQVIAQEENKSQASPKINIGSQSAPPTKPKKKERPGAAAPLLLDGVNYRITDDALGTGTPGERYANNIAAIHLLQKLETEGRSAVPEEQAVLANYVGWGGLAECFEPQNRHYNELKELLSDAEYASARESTLTAFFTPPVVIRAIYQALVNMGITQGNLLEPSCGTGNFLGLLPESMAHCKLYGVELDNVSGRIARQLYQKASVSICGFEQAEFPDNFFDAAVGNVPFGQFSVKDRRYDRLNLPIHEYFLAKTLDKVRPGGIIALVTSSFTLDKRTEKARKYIAQRADLLRQYVCRTMRSKPLPELK